MSEDRSLIDKTARGMMQMLAEGGAMDMLIDQTKRMMWSVVEYKELQMLYTCAMKEIRTKLEVLDCEFKLKNKRNPISSISSRLKRTESVFEKLIRRKIPVGLDSIRENINDIAGVRVICPYVDDIYLIADALLNQDDVTLIARKDYIENPKPNGYRSLHLILSIPVFLSDARQDVKVEVQIRTIAMDYWASLEHQMKYKKDIPDADAVSNELRLCAASLADIDQRMIALRRHIDSAEDIQSEDEELIDRLRRLDLPI